MGSFDYTCAVSGLPISAGDPVRFMLLSENHFKENACEITDVWVPRNFPIKAKYNDYGSIEEYEEGILKDLMMEAFDHDLHEVEVGDNKYHDVAVYHGMAFYKFLEALWEQRVSVNRPSTSRSKGPSAVRQAMIREDVWQVLLKYKLDESEYKSNTLAHFKKGASIVWADALNGARKMSPDDSINIGSIRAALGNMGSDVASAGCIQGHLQRTPAISNWKHQLGLAIQRQSKATLSDADRATVVDTLAECCFVSTVLSLTRYWWRPSYPCGPQQGAYADHAEILKLFSTVALKASKEWDER